MSTFEAAVKFFGTYPSWAKIAMLIGLIVTFGVALLAPRTGGSASQHFALLKIYGVNSDALPPDSMVRVTAIVNGKAYIYPSLAGVDWLRVGPTMSSQSFPLSQTPPYEVRFEMEARTSGASAAKRYVSQETVTIPSIPHTSVYRLYPVTVDAGGVSRGAIPGSSVKYSFESAQ
jgi:hypothetical protein